MKKDDLTQLKYVGPTRMKLLNDAGITTIKQLSETPLEKLTQIDRISEHYAKLIKDAATEVYREKPEKPSPKTMSGKKKKVEEFSQDLSKQFKVLNKRLKQANENFKPLGKKKYLKLYVEFKKNTETLKAHLNGLNKNPDKLSPKATKNIIKNAGALSATLKNVGKKPKKKKYQKASQEIQSFSNVLK